MFNLFKKSEDKPVAAVAAPASSIKFRDRRLFLKVKLKSLAAEAKIIRAGERRQAAAKGILHGELYAHRTGIVRAEARHTLLAYSFLRGKTYRQIEAKAREAPQWVKVEAMVRKYGEAFGGNWKENEAETARVLERFQRWRAEI